MICALWRYYYREIHFTMVIATITLVLISLVYFKRLCRTYFNFYSLPLNFQMFSKSFVECQSDEHQIPRQFAAAVRIVLSQDINHQSYNLKVMTYKHYQISNKLPHSRRKCENRVSFDINIWSCDKHNQDLDPMQFPTRRTLRPVVMPLGPGIS